ncbi:MAG: hypothetical protein LC658_11625 [Bacteroidales bacterium]|nr:hypothetical protein [Bacteroidales bacterium]
MEKKQLIQVCGAIIKEESIVPITSNIANNTCVAEANKPYSDYFGIAPFNMPTKPNSLFLFTATYYTLEEAMRFAKLIDLCSVNRLNIADHTCVAEANKPYSDYYKTAPFNFTTKPNSLFLFTVPFYSLEEVLRFAQYVDLNCLQNLNIASSVLDFGANQYPAIRIKNFSDYRMLLKLQQCFIVQGVEFAAEIHMGDRALIRTNKIFSLDEIAGNIYLDHLQNKTGYVALTKLISNELYNKVIFEIRNNTNCPMFDAARGAILFRTKITDIVRIYSEDLDIELLKRIQIMFEHLN